MPAAGFLRLHLLFTQALVSPKTNHPTGNATHTLEVDYLGVNLPKMNRLDLPLDYVHWASSLGMNLTHDL
jgi:hypothetical protein